MSDQEKRMESCSHVWEYYTQTFDDVFLRCPRCGMVRIAMPGETAARVSRELLIRHDGKDGDV